MVWFPALILGVQRLTRRSYDMHVIGESRVKGFCDPKMRAGYS